jgi:hypothetical protein
MRDISHISIEIFGKAKMARPKTLEERMIVRFPKGTFARFGAVVKEPLAVVIRELALSWLAGEEHTAKRRERAKAGKEQGG